MSAARESIKLIIYQITLYLRLYKLVQWYLQRVVQHSYIFLPLTTLSLNWSTIAEDCSATIKLFMKKSWSKQLDSLTPNWMSAIFSHKLHLTSQKSHTKRDLKRYRLFMKLFLDLPLLWNWCSMAIFSLQNHFLLIWKN